MRSGKRRSDSPPRLHVSSSRLIQDVVRQGGVVDVVGDLRAGFSHRCGGRRYLGRLAVGNHFGLDHLRDRSSPDRRHLVFAVARIDLCPAAPTAVHGAKQFLTATRTTYGHGRLPITRPRCSGPLPNPNCEMRGYRMNLLSSSSSLISSRRWLTYAALISTRPRFMSGASKLSSSSSRSMIVYKRRAPIF